MPEEAKPTLYHDSVDHLRRDLIASHLAYIGLTKTYRGALLGDDVGWKDAVHDAMDASEAACSLSYTLAAVLGFAGREFGEDVAHKLACVADNVLTNGDDGNIPHNFDVLPVAASAEGESR